MTLDEAIRHCEEVAEAHTKYNSYGGYESCDECAADHRQLAEWLTELRQWRRVFGVCPSYEMCIPECKEGYDAQIAEYKRLLKAAAKIAKKSPCDDDNCSECVHNDNGYVLCSEYDCFEWRFKGEAEKLLGEKI